MAEFFPILTEKRQVLIDNLPDGILSSFYLTGSTAVLSLIRQFVLQTFQQRH
jgi:hypothetical protein